MSDRRVTRQQSRLLHRRSGIGVANRPQRTPSHHKFRGPTPPDSSETGSDENEEQSIANFVAKKRLKIYQVGRMYGMAPHLENLPMMSKAIRDFLRMHSSNTAKYTNVKSSVQTIEDARGDTEGIIISVTMKNMNDKKTDEIFWGLLCHHTINSDQIALQVDPQFVYCPLFFVKGNVSITNKVLAFFYETYDSTIREVVLSPQDLIWIATMWASSNAVIKHRSLLLKYETPDFDTMNSIELSVGAAEISDLWKWVHTNDSDEFSLDEVLDFFNSLENHIKAIFKVNVERLSLVEIYNTSLHVTKNGKITLFSPMTSRHIICHLVSVVIKRYPL